VNSMWDLINQRAALQGVREELKLALDTTTGGVLSPESLEPKIVELVRKISPLVAGLKVIESNGKTHEFNERSALPSAQFEGEKAVTPTSQSTYARKATPLKIVRAKGGVTGFQQAASRKFINSYVNEIAGAAQALAWIMEFGVMWGNAVADQYQYDGLDTKIITNRLQPNAVITLRQLDDLIDRIIGVGPLDLANMAFYLSPQMHSKISSLASEVRKILPKISYPGGLEMESYRGIALVDTSFCRPTSTMGTIVLADDATVGGLIAATQYRWKVAAITQFGEQWASAEVTHTTGGGITSAKITFSAVPGALLYKVYRTLGGGAVGTEVLASIHAANTYDVNGTVIGVITQIIDVVADGALGTDIPLDSATVEETLFLANRDQDISLEIASLLNEQGEKVQNLIQMLPLARTKDQEEFLLLSYQALIYKGDIFNGMLRTIRIA